MLDATTLLSIARSVPTSALFPVLASALENRADDEAFVALETAHAIACDAEESWTTAPGDDDDAHLLAYSDAIDAARDALRTVCVERDVPRTWIATDETGSVDQVLGSLTIADARASARDWAEDGGYDTSEGTVYLRYRIRCALTREEEDVRIALQPKAPKCPGPDNEGGEHDWQSHYGIVGGLKENPGVWGHGGGVLVREVCMHCGCGRTTDTWAHDPATGEEGLESIRYEPRKYECELARLHEEETTFEGEAV